MDRGHLAIGRRIKRLRESSGLSRQLVAAHLSVDLTAVAAWEAGKYLPRQSRRVRLASLLGLDVNSLFAEEQDDAPAMGHASLIDTLGELPGLLRNLTENAQRDLKAFRMAAPYATPAHVQEEFRAIVDARLRAGTLDVHRMEVIYSLARLKEIVANIFRYDDMAYRVKSYCAGVKDVVPAMGGYIFDDSEVLLGAYWAKVPPVKRSGLRLSGEPFRSYFLAYWSESWSRGALLNPDGPRDLSAARETALELGLAPGDWTRFVDEARRFEMDDGLPPLI
jgi:transcriptional regulator with XRE-family HTH domain